MFRIERKNRSAALLNRNYSLVEKEIILICVLPLLDHYCISGGRNQVSFSEQRDLFRGRFELIEQFLCMFSYGL